MNQHYELEYNTPLVFLSYNKYTSSRIMNLHEKLNFDVEVAADTPLWFKTIDISVCLIVHQIIKYIDAKYGGD